MKMAYINERHRVEAALPAAILYRCMSTMHQKGYETDDGADQVLAALKTALDEPLQGLTAKDADRLARRINRDSRSVTMTYHDRPVALVLIAMCEALRLLADDGSFLMVSGSPLDQAFEALVSEVEQHQDIVDGMGKSGEKNGRRIVDRLRAMGYYQQVRAAA